MDRILKFQYQQVAEQIKQQIVTGHLRVGDRLMSERLLSRQFGVQRNTIRQALESLELQGHIATQIRKGSYVLPAAQGNKSGTLLINIARDSGPNGTALFEGLATEAEKFGFKLQRTNTEPLPDSSMNRIPDPSSLPSDTVGVIIWPHHPTDVGRLNRLNETVPLVLVDHRVTETSIDCVRFNDIEGGKLVTQYLFDRGHRRIAFLTDDVFAESVQGRWQGYMVAHEEAKIPAEARLSMLYHFFDPEISVLTLRHLLQDEKARPTAFLCSNDLVAFTLLRYLNADGFRVPEDVAVTGYGNAMPDYMAAISLTSVDQPFFEVGRQAARLISERTRQTVQERLSTPQDIVLSVNLVVRSSA